MTAKETRSAATGGAEAETPDDLRLALPASVRTLDRAVALEDQIEATRQTIPAGPEER